MPEVTPAVATAALEKIVMTAQYYGDSGGSTQYWYWVQAIYPWGYGQVWGSAPVTVLSLSHSNVVSLNWTPQPTSSYFNVWRTTTSAAPTTGTSQCIATGLSTADGLVDNGLPGFTIAAGTAGPMMLTPEEQKAADKKIRDEQEAEAKMSPADLQKKREEQAKKAEADQKKLDEEAKKASEEAAKKTDELLKELEETQKAADEQALKDAEKAEKLNRLYNERYQLPLRETESQRKAREAKEPKEPKEHEPKQHVHSFPEHEKK